MTRWEEVPEYVWCDVHGCIHEKGRDPYGTGEAECGPLLWRAIAVDNPHN